MSFRIESQNILVPFRLVRMEQSLVYTDRSIMISNINKTWFLAYMFLLLIFSMFGILTILFNLKCAEMEERNTLKNKRKVDQFCMNEWSSNSEIQGTKYG